MGRNDIGYEYRPFDPSAAVDPEVATRVDAFVSKAAKNESGFSHTYKLGEVEGSDLVFKKDPVWGGRILMALVGLSWHLRAEQDRLLELIGDRADENTRLNVHHVPGANPLHTRRAVVSHAVSQMCRRKLALSREELVTLIDAAGNEYGWECVPCQSVVKPVEHFAAGDSPGEAVVKALESLRGRMSHVRFREHKKVQARVDQLVTVYGAGAEGAALVYPPSAEHPPAMAGHLGVLVELKAALGLLETAVIDDTGGEVIGADRFRLRADSPLFEEHNFLNEVVEDYVGTHQYHDPELMNGAFGPTIQAMSDEARGRLLLAACERAVSVMINDLEGFDPDDPASWQSRSTAMALPAQICALEIDLDRAGWFDLFLLAAVSNEHVFTLSKSGYDVMERLVAEKPATAGELHLMHRLRIRLIVEPPMGACPPMAARICRMMGEPDGYWLVPGEHWSDRVHADLAEMSPESYVRWQALLKHALTASASKPTAKWLKAGAELVQAIGHDEMIRRLADWFAEVSRGRSARQVRQHQYDTRGGADVINEGNATVLRGLVWLFAKHPTADAPRAVADLLLTSVKKVSGVGPRAVKVANACVWALGELASESDERVRDNALGQLARLKAKVTFRTTLNAIEKALDKAAAASGVSRDEIEELGVPAFGFEGGVLREAIGAAKVDLAVEGHKVVVRWTNDKGKAVKSPPAAVKRDFKDEVKELKQFAKDAEGVLLAGRDRLDTLFLKNKDWPLGEWRERYLDHGLLCTLVRRLIWLIDGVPVMFEGDSAVDVGGEAVRLKDSSRVRLWHPVGYDQAEVLAWREYVEAKQITQPFKQAHREVYLLTDAEMNTAVYSNRYAAHLIKQHQFNALCGVRGWRNQLRLMVDDEYPPATLELPAWGLRAEFWVEGAGEEYGVDTNETGTYLCLATDQVRFYPMDTSQLTAHAGGGGYDWGRWRGEAEPEPIPLDQIPALVFSEVMRDVDLFVGVASVGNDPVWEDGGRQQRYGYDGYWANYSFGDLSGTAQTRKDLLQRLVPRLKIADRCSFDNKFLIVKGSVRTYKIHLGSGNILMEPNDQYLCIVPGRGAVTGPAGKVFLPFEGDRTLSIILSKAFMLAEDSKVTDTTILSQIKPR